MKTISTANSSSSSSVHSSKSRRNKKSPTRHSKSTKSKYKDYLENSDAEYSDSMVYIAKEGGERVSFGCKKYGANHRVMVCEYFNR